MGAFQLDGRIHQLRPAGVQDLSGFCPSVRRRKREEGWRDAGGSKGPLQRPGSTHGGHLELEEVRKGNGDAQKRTFFQFVI